MVVVIVLAEGFSVLRGEELTGQLFLADSADEVVRMVRFVERIDSRALDGFLAMATGRAEGLLPVFYAIRVAVHALADVSVFELALAHLAQQVVHVPHHVEGLQVRAINGLLAGSASTVALHGGKIKTEPKRRAKPPAADFFFFFLS